MDLSFHGCKFHNLTIFSHHGKSATLNWRINIVIYLHFVVFLSLFIANFTPFYFHAIPLLRKLPLAIPQNHLPQLERTIFLIDKPNKRATKYTRSHKKKKRKKRGTTSPLLNRKLTTSKNLIER